MSQGHAATPDPSSNSELPSTAPEQVRFLARKLPSIDGLLLLETGHSAEEFAQLLEQSPRNVGLWQSFLQRRADSELKDQAIEKKRLIKNLACAGALGLIPISYLTLHVPIPAPYIPGGLALAIMMLAVLNYVDLVRSHWRRDTALDAIELLGSYEQL